ncbi:hypothetical protein ACFL2F_01620 [Myxococcota bacterium]
MNVRSLLLCSFLLTGCVYEPAIQGLGYPVCETDADCWPACRCLDDRICVPINSGLGPKACTNCSNLVVDYVDGEQCDDGNFENGDGCDAYCRLEQPPTCGDDHLDINRGEECDDGNRENGDGCSSTCQFETVGEECGNGDVEGLEVCDNGDAQNKDMCSLNTNPVCSCSPPCGCNPTCNLTATTVLYAGQPGIQGLTDGDRLASALIGGYGVMTASNQHIYFSDGAHNIVRRVDVDTGMVETIAGDAVQGNAGYLNDPMGLKALFAGIEAVTTDGRTLWLADSGNHVIRAVDLTSPQFPVTTVAGVQYPGGTNNYQDHTDPLQAEFDGLRGLTYYRNVIYLVDGNAATLRSFDLKTGEVKTLAGQVNNPGNVDANGTSAQFMSPRYMTSDNSGMLYIADTEGAKIRTYNTMTGYVGTFAGSGVQGYVDGQSAAVMIHRPRGLTSDGTSIYWVEFDSHTVRQGHLTTKTVTTLVGTPDPGTCGSTGGYMEGVGNQAEFSCPFSLVYHFPTRSIYVLDSGNLVIRRIK